MPSFKNVISRIILILIISILPLCVSYAQKHTFTNNLGVFKNYITGESIESEDIDNITIENIGGGKYLFSDSKETTLFKYSHIEHGMFIYKKVNGLSVIKTIQKLSLFTEGKPGKLIIEIEGAAFELRYKLDN
jgi:hypothetical protein